jgi:hypothetical protein
MTTTTADAWRGGLRLFFDSVGGITHTVEAMHRTVAATPAAWLGRDDGRLPAHGPIAAAVYAVIRAVNGGLREGIDLAWDLGEAAGMDASRRDELTDVRALAILNGIVGDHLDETDNPLGIRMHFRSVDGVRVGTATIEQALPSPSPHVVILLHGLCMSERGWHRRGQHALADAVATDLGQTPVYLRYNSGRRISANGRELALRLDELLRDWPVIPQSLTLVGHSMGGLLDRSAAAYGERDARSWRPLLRGIVTLGTPHHGAPLERGGQRLHKLLELSPYVRPLAFGRLRSAGIRDLRYGNLLDEDWQCRPEGPGRGDRRTPLPLAEGVHHWFVAGSIAESPVSLRRRTGADDDHAASREGADVARALLGDLLVPVASALGRHEDPRRDIALTADRQRIFARRDHMALLDDPDVVTQVVNWLAADTR